MAANLQPDPSVIGGVPSAPFVFLPNPATLFDSRARRFAFLAEGSRLAPYLAFLAGVLVLEAIWQPSPARVPIRLKAIALIAADIDR